MKIYLVRGIKYDEWSRGRKELKAKNLVIACCATKELADEFVASYAPFAEDDPELYRITDVPESKRFSERAVREIRKFDDLYDMRGERIALWIDERDLIGAESDDEPVAIEPPVGSGEQ